MDVTTFFEQYENAFNQKDVEQLVPYYFLPTILMNADEKLIFVRAEQIEDFLHQIIQEATQSGVERIAVELKQVMKLAKNIVFCNVEWRYFDKQGDNIMISPVSYTLQLKDEGHPQIIAIVRDKEPAFRKS